MKNYKEIAMRCNKEQFEAIKPKLDKEGVKTVMIQEFKKNFYLAIIFDGSVTNGTISNKEGRLMYEQWNEKIFLEACGIETEPTYQITKETILKYNMKDEFPDVFEVKFENGYYKHKNGKHQKWFWYMDFYTLENYGKNETGNWSKNIEGMDWYIIRNCEPMTHQEVETALKNEAVKRGFVEGAYFEDLHIKTMGCVDIVKYHEDSEDLRSDGYCIFHKGKWANILKIKTIQQAEELLKELGHEIKIVS